MYLHIAQYISMFTLPVLAAVLWKIRTGAPSKLALAAIASITAFHYAKIPINKLFFASADSFLAAYSMPFRPTHDLLLFALALALARHAIHWLALWPRLTGPKTWQNGVFYGLSLTAWDAIFDTWERVDSHLAGLAQRVGQSKPTSPHPTTLENISALLDASPGWVRILLDEPQLSLVPIIPIVQSVTAPLMINLGTALAILYAIRYRKPWAFAAAVLCYAVAGLGNLPGPKFTAYETTKNFIATSENAQQIMGHLSPRISQLTMGLTIMLPPIIAALPALALALYIRKAFIKNLEKGT